MLKNTNWKILKAGKKREKKQQETNERMKRSWEIASKCERNYKLKKKMKKLW